LPHPRGANENADNSNTQFAILALWIARKQKLPLDYTFAQVERRFRSAQYPDGWGYTLLLGAGRGYGSMTCVGLLGLAVGRGYAPEMPATVDRNKLLPSEDKGITGGLLALGSYLQDPTDKRSWGAPSPSWGPKGALNLYFLWSVERVGVLLNLKTIGGMEWYPWGVDLLLAAQKKDGSWIGRGNGGSPVIDTSCRFPGRCR